MTILDNGTRNQYTATSGQTLFTYDFEIFADTDIVVYKDGVLLTLSTDYTVSGVGNENGGTITLLVGATTGQVITLTRDVPASRESDYSASGFQPSELNSDLDRIWANIQQIKTDQDFSPRVSETTTVTLPILYDSPVGSRYLRWKTDLSGIESVALTSGISSPSDYVLKVQNYAQIRALDSSLLNDGDLLCVSDDNTGGLFRVVTGAVADDGDTLIVFTDDSGRHAKRITTYTDYHAADVSSNSDFYSDSGAADAYVLSAISPNVSPTSYRDGMRVRFIPDNNCTGGAVTVNVAGLGTKNVKLYGGANPASGDMDGMVTLEFDLGNNYFVIQKGFVPSGTVISVAQNSAPSGYLKANGAAVSRTAYAALFAAIGTTFGVGDGSTTFNLPDLRGEFVRGWDDGRGVDSGRVFGSAQTDDFKSHTHNIGTTTTYGAGAISGIYSTVSQTDPTTATGGTETRPRNIALLYCIKY